MHNFVDYISVIVHIGMYFLLAVTKRRQFPRLGESADRFRPIDWFRYGENRVITLIAISNLWKWINLAAIRDLFYLHTAALFDLRVKRGTQKLNPRKSLSCSVLFILWPLVETKYSIREISSPDSRTYGSLVSKKNRFISFVQENFSIKSKEQF